jgi:hypothetical protein
MSVYYQSYTNNLFSLKHTSYSSTSPAKTKGRDMSAVGSVVIKVFAVLAFSS